MPKIKFNEANRKYYSDDFIKGFEVGVDRQYKADQKTGHWIYNPKTDLSNCNNCGFECMHDELGRIETNFCPNCGAMMIEPPESEG